MTLQVTQNKDEEFQDGNCIPSWHIYLVRKRYQDYFDNPNQAVDFDSALNDIEKELE